MARMAQACSICSMRHAAAISVVRAGLDAVAGDGTHFAPWLGIGAIGALGARDASQTVTLGLASQTLSAAAMPGLALETEAGPRQKRRNSDNQNCPLLSAAAPDFA